MLSVEQAKAAVEAEEPGAKALACVEYRDAYLVRVTHADPDEAGFDPFYSVNMRTGEVSEFSVMTDGNPQEIAKAFAQT